MSDKFDGTKLGDIYVLGQVSGSNDIVIDKNGMATQTVERLESGQVVWREVRRWRTEGAYCPTCDNTHIVPMGTVAVATCPDCSEFVTAGSVTPGAFITPTRPGLTLV